MHDNVALYSTSGGNDAGVFPEDAMAQALRGFSLPLERSSISSLTNRRSKKNHPAKRVDPLLEGSGMGKGRVFIIVTAVISILFTTSDVSLSSSDKKTIIIKAKIEKVLKLIVDTTLISFPNKDPDEITEIPAVQNDVKVIVKVRAGSTSPVTLNLIADGDLLSGSDTIPVQNVSWQASGQGFQGGLLSKATVQTAGSWRGCGVREGAFRYYLKNSWNYPRGEYQITITYTLTTP